MKPSEKGAASGQTGRQPRKNSCTFDPYGTDDPDTLTVRAASVTDCTGLIPSGTDSDEVLNLMLRFIIILQISFTDHDKPYRLIISFFQKFPANKKKRCLFSALLQHDEDLFQLCLCLSMHGTVQIRAFALIILPTLTHQCNLFPIHLYRPQCGP